MALHRDRARRALPIKPVPARAARATSPPRGRDELVAEPAAPSMRGRTVVVTGANSGVGKATAAALAGPGPAR